MVGVLMKATTGRGRCRAGTLQFAGMMAWLVASFERIV